jgi:hypothetical protein
MSERVERIRGLGPSDELYFVAKRTIIGTVDRTVFPA